MEKLLLTIIVSLFVCAAIAAPPNSYFVNGHTGSQNRATAPPAAFPQAPQADPLNPRKPPAKIAYLAQQQSEQGNEFQYVDTDGNGRWEKLVLNDVQHGDEVRRVPSTVGGFNFTSPDGVKVSQTYSSGVNGSFFSIVHNGQQL